MVLIGVASAGYVICIVQEVESQRIQFNLRCRSCEELILPLVLSICKHICADVNIQPFDFPVGKIEVG